ncbi:MAG: hypothetical protein DHS20C08_02350 [Rhodomicrobium sp.]|nr:MAG: hypothetical protein DHS20C08_02350 [Rhodomicrobium sp.]
MTGFFITGTDTDVGKTVASAWAVLQLHGVYWKPVQSGIEESETDSQFVARVAGLQKERLLKSQVELKAPLSPDQAAELENTEIKLSDFTLPATDRPLVVEGAGGVMVPLNKKEMMIDLMGKFNLPVILVARSGLGTINHSLLSISALRDAGLTIAGVILNGIANERNRAAIERFGSVRILAELPVFARLDKASLMAVLPSTPIEEWAAG